MYVFLPREADPEALPAALLERFGAPEHVMDLDLTPDRYLARAEAPLVLAQIAEQGFYLQMPPTTDELTRRRKE